MSQHQVKLLWGQLATPASPAVPGNFPFTGRHLGIVLTVVPPYRPLICFVMLRWNPWWGRQPLITRLLEVSPHPTTGSLLCMHVVKHGKTHPLHKSKAWRSRGYLVPCRTQDKGRSTKSSRCCWCHLMCLMLIINDPWSALWFESIKAILSSSWQEKYFLSWFKLSLCMTTNRVFFSFCMHVSDK